VALGLSVETTEAHLLVHCRAGVSRSTAAALILMQANPEWPASAALDAVAAIRPRVWPNLLILEFGDALLGRNGEIAAAAAGAIYRRVLARDPEFGDQMNRLPNGKVPAGPAGVQPLQNARIGGYHAFVAAKLVVHSGNTGSAGAKRSR
jgi:hypothetical protein